MNGGASAMTLLEREAYLDPGGAAVNVTHGYPQGLTPGWVRDLQEHPPPGFPDLPPGGLEAVIGGWFARFLGGGDVALAPSCTVAFAIAAQAIMRSPGDEFIVIDRSYDSYPRLLAALGARVAWAGRDASGVPDPGSVAAACTGRTRAVVIVSPDNPLGVITPAAVLAQLAALCQQRGLTLLADHCLAGVNPLRAPIPLLPRLAGRGLSWIALGDTGKILGLGGTKLGALAYPDRWQKRIEAAASAWYFQLPAYDLAVIAAVVSDPRFAPYLAELSTRIGAHYLRLREQVRPPLRVAPPGAGPFALIDAAGLGLDDQAYARLLADRHGVLAIPVSWFPSPQPAPETRIRVSLARPGAVIEQLAAALNASAARTAQQPAP